MSRIKSFIVYAFTIPFICVLLMRYVEVCQSGVLNLVLYAIEGASPAIAAIVVVWRREKMSGLKNYLAVRYIRDFKVKYCIVAFLVPAVMLTIAQLVVNLIYGERGFVHIPSGKKWLILLWALVAEELGWRGYLQERVEAKVGCNLTPFVVGVIWTLWHYHFFIIEGMEVPFIVFAYGCIVESYGYYVMSKNAKGNVVPVSIWHFSGNLFFNLYLLNPNWNNGSIVPYCIVNGVYSVYVVAFIVYRRGIKENNYVK